MANEKYPSWLATSTGVGSATPRVIVRDTVDFDVEIVLEVEEAQRLLDELPLAIAQARGALEAYREAETAAQVAAEAARAAVYKKHGIAR